VFVSAAAVSRPLEQMLRTAREQRFAVDAYCFMPDHVHALFCGEAAHSNFKALMTLFRRRAAYVHARMFRARLWQVGYYERVLRDGESPVGAITYIAANPVRAGLVTHAGEYPYCYIADEFACRVDLASPKGPD
jgi:putative transposase